MERLDDLLSGPCRSWVLGYIEMNNAAPVNGQEDQYVQHGKANTKLMAKRKVFGAKRGARFENGRHTGNGKQSNFFHRYSTTQPVTT